MKIAVVIPCYRVRDRVMGVVATIGPEVSRIYCVDDACPEGTGAHVRATCTDPRVEVLTNPVNLGVGGAVKAGYAKAIADGMEIVVKIDGDGQMDPALLPTLVQPLLRGEADYVKANRFYSIETLRGMPAQRLIGNALLSFFTKLSTGYWSIFDPTNGYTAIDAYALALLPLDKIADRYFFESDMLFRLSTIRAVVTDVPMAANYQNTVSSLKIGKIVLPFLAGHSRNFAKRIAYNYFLRDFQVASLELVVGLACLLFGISFGLVQWIGNARAEILTSPGNVMLATLPIIVGVQLLMGFLSYDIQTAPRRPLCRNRIVQK